MGNISGDILSNSYGKVEVQGQASDIAWGYGLEIDNFPGHDGK